MKTRKKTQRIYTPLRSIRHYVEKLAQHGDKVIYEYTLPEENTGAVHTISYAAFSVMVQTEAAGLDAAGLSGKRIGIIGPTSPEWVCSYLAIIAAGGVAIPFDRELKTEEILGFLAVSEAEAVICAPTYYENLKPALGNHPTLKVLIPMEPAETENSSSEPLPDGVIPLPFLMDCGASAIKKGYQMPPTGDMNRMTEMLFTSGTTGSSKCVMLCERNIVAAVNSACECVEFFPDETIVSVLPLHHTYELCCMLAAMNYGNTIAINDSLKRVLRNFSNYRPTALVLVPLFVQTMYRKIWDEAKKKGKDIALRTMLVTSRGLRAIGIDLRKKFFGQITAAFGGRLQKIICGGAPLNPELAQNLSEFGIEIYEGYGITECAPLISVNPYFAPKKGSVGPAVNSCAVKIDAEEKNEKGFDEGEILVKGDNVMLGYYKDPENTAAAFTDDGYFRTGDIGYLDNDGYIFITGRKKSMIVLESGKNVFPEEMEEYLNQIPEIAESVVIGRKAPEGDRIVLTAVICPDFEKFEHPEDMSAVEASVRAKIDALNRKLPSYKQIREVEFRSIEFEKTTSKKIKRFLIK